MQLYETDRDIINELCLAYPRYCEPSQMALTLESLKTQCLASPDSEVRQRYSDRVYNQVVQNKSLSSSCRLKGIEVLVQANNLPDNSPSDDQVAVSGTYA